VRLLSNVLKKLSCGADKMFKGNRLGLTLKCFKKTSLVDCEVFQRNRLEPMLKCFKGAVLSSRLNVYHA